MKLDYSVTLTDCPISGRDKDEAVNLYKKAIERELGGKQAAAEAARDYQRLMEKYEEYPLPDEATNAEAVIAGRWAEADKAGQRAAFAGWAGDPGPANFEVSVWAIHPNTGNKHASKGGYDSHLHVRCSSRDKAGWVKKAQREGLKTAEWVIRTLNEASS